MQVGAGGENEGTRPSPSTPARIWGVVPDRFTALQPGDGANIAIKLKVIARTRQGLPSLESHMLFFYCYQVTMLSGQETETEPLHPQQKKKKPRPDCTSYSFGISMALTACSNSKLFDSDSRDLHCLKLVPPLGFSAARDASQL